MSDDADELALYERDVQFADQALDAAIAVFGHAEVIRQTTIRWRDRIIADLEPLADDDVPF